MRPLPEIDEKTGRRSRSAPCFPSWLPLWESCHPPSHARRMTERASYIEHAGPVKIGSTCRPS